MFYRETEDGMGVELVESRHLAWSDRWQLKTYLPGGYWVSTVFLAVEHGMTEDGPMLYESMAFPPDSMHELSMQRYTHRYHATTGHESMVEATARRIANGELPADL